jgi:DNA-binding transcriptional MerR regulator
MIAGVSPPPAPAARPRSRGEQAGDGGGARWRVAELAARAGLSVDTIRFYQKRALLPPPAREGRVGWYGPEHAERLARIRELQAQGFTLATIRRLLDGELDPADLPLVAAVTSDRDGDGSAGAEEFLSLEEVAARAGVPFALVDAVAREGLLVPRRHAGEARFTEADVAIVRAALRLVETGLPLPELFSLARRHHESTRETAEQAVEMFDEHVRRPLLRADLPADERARQLVAAFRVLLPSVSALVSHHFRRVLLEVAQEHIESVGEPAERAAIDAEGARRLEGRLA